MALLGGVDGIRSQHLGDLLAHSNGDAGDDLREVMRVFVDNMVQGRIPDNILSYVYGATLPTA